MRKFLTSWVSVVGAGLIVAGSAQVSHALGLVVAGVALIGVAVSERDL